MPGGRKHGKVQVTGPGGFLPTFNIILLGVVSLLTDVSTEMVYPLLPFYLTMRLGASPAILGLIEGLAESVASLLKVVSGRISDKVGRRKGLAVVGYGSSAIGKVLLFVTGSWGGVLAGRVGDRFGKGIRTAPRDAMVAESAQKGRQGWSFGLHRAMDALGATGGALLAYFLIMSLTGGGLGGAGAGGGTGVTGGPSAAGYRVIFLYSLIPAALGVVALFFVRETGRRKASAAGAPVAGATALAETSGARVAGAPEASATPAAPKHRGPSLWAVFAALDPRLKTLLVVTAIFTLGNSSNQFLLLRAGESIGEGGALLVYVLFNAVYALFSWPAGWASDKLGRKRVLVCGFALYGLVYGALAFGLGGLAWGYAAIFGVYGVYSALTDGVAKALVADLAPGDLRATVMGLHATIVGIGLFPASFLAGVLWSAFGPSAAFGLGAAAGLVAAVGLGFFPKRAGAARAGG